MSNKAKQKRVAQAERRELELKKKNGIIKIVVSVAVFIVFMLLRLYINVSGIIPIDDMWFNLVTLVVAFLMCYFAGTGSNDVARARRRIKEIDAGQYRKKAGPTEKW